MDAELERLGASNVDQSVLEAWHGIVLSRDWDRLPELLVDDVTYHGPAQLEPLRGRDAFVSNLRVVFGVFEDFAYHRAFAGRDGYVLEFEGSVGERRFGGIDILRIDATGRIADLVVMLRPFDIVPHLGAAIAARGRANHELEGG